jgi:hypothetical protein
MIWVGAGIGLFGGLVIGFCIGYSWIVWHPE